MNIEKRQQLEELVHNIRIDIVQASYSAGTNGSHLGGCLSMSELLGVLYNDFIHYDIKDLENRDRVILSKGHGALALYATLHQRGLLSEKDLNSFEQNGSIFTAHAHRDLLHGLEFTGGSLGLGMTYATGVAYSCKLKNLSSKVYCLLGDGELNEGIIWESLMFASHNQLSNLTIIIDQNHLQIGGNTEHIINMTPLKDKLEAFGFYTILVDGHDVEALYNAYSVESNDKPKAIIAETVKGKGVSFIEDKYKWHFGVLTEAKYNKAMGELKNNRLI